MTRRRTVAQAGFTLVEVMIAVAILVLMMAIAWGAVSQTMRAKKYFGAIQDRYREARQALGRISRDIEMAYLSGNEDRTLTETRTFFIGDATGDDAALRFSAFSHTRLYSDANESDQTVVAYYTGPDPEIRGATDIIRRESRREGPDKWDALPGEADPIFTDVKKLKIFYFDAKDQDWHDSWTSNGEGTANRLPERVRIEITFSDDQGKDIKLVTQARIVLQEVLQFYAN